MRSTLVLISVLSSVAVHAAVDTSVTVRAVSRDAKVIGDGVGGALIRIIDVESGAVLASGNQTGGTGDTETIMSKPWVRGKALYSGAAAWTTTLPLEKPTLVRIEATGPLGFPQAMATTSKELLLVPGEHIANDGVILEIHGFIVDLSRSIRAAGAAEINARVTMTCGCPLSPGGMWDSDTVSIVARYTKDGQPAEATLVYAGADSTFRATVAADEGSPVEVLALDAENANFGRAILEP